MRIPHTLLYLSPLNGAQIQAANQNATFFQNSSAFQSYATLKPSSNDKRNLTGSTDWEMWVQYIVLGNLLQVSRSVQRFIRSTSSLNPHPQNFGKFHLLLSRNSPNTPSTIVELLESCPQRRHYGVLHGSASTSPASPSPKPQFVTAGNKDADTYARMTSSRNFNVAWWTNSLRLEDLCPGPNHQTLAGCASHV